MQQSFQTASNDDQRFSFFRSLQNGGAASEKFSFYSPPGTGSLLYEKVEFMITIDRCAYLPLMVEL